MEEALPAAETNLPWSEEMGQLEALSGHYHDLLTRQRQRARIENYVKPELLLPLGHMRCASVALAVSATCRVSLSIH